jgi:hypothetical protein
VSRHDATAAIERCAFTHHLEKQIFTLLTDRRNVFEIDLDFSLLNHLALSPGLFQLCHPRIDEAPFEYQRSLAAAIGCSYLQHEVSHTADARPMPNAKPPKTKRKTLSKNEIGQRSIENS